MAEKLPDNPALYFLAHEVTLSELARLYRGRPGGSRSALSKRAAREDWWGRRRRLAASAAQRTDNKLAEAEAQRNARHLRGVKNVQTVADAIVQGVAAEIQRSGGIDAVMGDQKKARSLALVLRASQLALMGGICIERSMTGKGQEAVQRIFEAAAKVATDLDEEIGAPSGNGDDGNRGVSRTSRAMCLRGGARSPEEANA